MANLPSAIKKIRIDKRRTEANTTWRRALKHALKAKVATPDLYKVADKMAKLRIISKNKAARIKSRYATAKPTKP